MPEEPTTPAAPLTPEQVKQVADELQKNAHLYQDLVKALLEKQFGKVIELAPGVIAEARTDIGAATPVIGTVVSNVKAGVATTEFQMSSWLNKILAFIAILAPALEGLMAWVQDQPFREESFLITGLCAVLKTLVTVSYARNRAALKKPIITQ